MSLSQLTDHVQNVENFLAKATISSSSEAGAESLTRVWKRSRYISKLSITNSAKCRTIK